MWRWTEKGIFSYFWDGHGSTFRWSTPTIGAPLSRSRRAIPAQRYSKRRSRHGDSYPVAAQTLLAAQTPPVTPSGTGGFSGTGGYVVLVSSQRTEEDAQASYRVLQEKYPDFLGTRAPLVKRADIGAAGVFYRVTVGPFETSDEASRFCGDLKMAGGQCVVQKN